jgi:uncharacterized protein YukJ
VSTVGLTSAGVEVLIFKLYPIVLVDENINHPLGSELLIVYYGLHYTPFLKCLEVKDEKRSKVNLIESISKNGDGSIYSVIRP